MLKLGLPSITSVFTRQYRYNLLCTNTLQATEEEKEKEIERITQNICATQTCPKNFLTSWSACLTTVLDLFLVCASIDDPPTACCRSGCANCVFIVWAEALASKMENAGPDITEKIMKMVDDPSMKAYLEMELRIRGLKK